MYTNLENVYTLFYKFITNAEDNRFKQNDTKRLMHHPDTISILSRASDRPCFFSYGPKLNFHYYPLYISKLTIDE